MELTAELDHYSPPSTGARSPSCGRSSRSSTTWSVLPSFPSRPLTVLTAGSCDVQHPGFAEARRAREEQEKRKRQDSDERPESGEHEPPRPPQRVRRPPAASPRCRGSLTPSPHAART